MCFGRLFNRLSKAYYEYISFTLTDNQSDNQLEFKGNDNTHLTTACNAILDRTKNITSAVFYIPSEGGWYGAASFRVNSLNLSAIETMLSDPSCQLKTLTIRDNCLTIQDLTRLCSSLPHSLTQINVPELVLTRKADQQVLNSLTATLKNQDRELRVELIENPSTTHGTSYH